MSDTPQSYYCNLVSIRMSIFDIVLECGKNVAVEENGEVRLELNKECSIYMSPQHFKAMTIMLVRNLETYEKKFGKINLPEKKDDK